MAKLHFKYGTMNSGKTLDIIKTIHNYEESGFKVLLLKPSADTKGIEKVVSRAMSEGRPVDILVGPNDNIIDLIVDRLESNIKCILIDESQFLTKKQVMELFILTKAANISVICYGLRNNFKMEAFPGSAALLEKAEVLEEIPTICGCGMMARFVGRKVDGEFVTEGEEVVIDGADERVEYVPMCGKCYLEKVYKMDLNCLKTVITEDLDKEKIKELKGYY